MLQNGCFISLKICLSTRIALEMENKKYKISFCTVCMNRLHHLKQTLPKNINDNLGYGNIEFVLLNYNSKDDLDEWVKSEMQEYIDSGILTYYKTTEPESFHMSHSKNVVARCATGDIICNIDADNFTGEGFADYTNKMFYENDNIFLTTDTYHSIRDCYGRICIKKKDFYKSCGYDENMESYGFEDNDLKNRLQLLSLTKVYITDRSFLSAISHQDTERLKNDKIFLEFEGVFIRYIDYASSIVVFLFKNSRCFIGEVIINRLFNSESIENLFIENREFDDEFSILGDKWENNTWVNIDGNYSFNNNSIILSSIKNELIEEKNSTDSFLIINNVEFIEIKDHEDILTLTMFYSQITNRNRMKENERTKKIIVNEKPYGRATLIKNFKEAVTLR